MNKDHKIKSSANRLRKPLVFKSSRGGNRQEKAQEVGDDKGVKRKQRNRAQHYRGEGHRVGHLSDTWEDGSNKLNQKGSQKARQRGKVIEMEM